MHNETRNAWHMGDEALPIQESEHDASETNVGPATDDDSGGCYVHLLTFCYSEFFPNQIYKPGTNSATSRPQMSTKHSPRTRKHHSSGHIRTSGNHHKDQGCTVRHRWMTTLSRKFLLPCARTFNSVTSPFCRVDANFPWIPLPKILSTVHLYMKNRRRKLSNRFQWRRSLLRSATRLLRLPLPLLPRRWTTGVIPSLQETGTRTWGRTRAKI